MFYVFAEKARSGSSQLNYSPVPVRCVIASAVFRFRFPADVERPLLLLQDVVHDVTLPDQLHHPLVQLTQT